MITGLFITAGCCAVMVVMLLAAFHRAPRGWQDRRGFHFGEPGKTK